MSKSKYKVYMHQDTFIVNKNFIYDLLNIFKDENVGMFGACGCSKLPKDAVWWNDENIKGKIYQNVSETMLLDDFEVKGIDEDRRVEAIDGVVMVTQYDIPWREDIFDGWHFYDLSQCVEFRRKGYDVIVPYQKEPWFLHDCGFVSVDNGYEKYREKMLAYLSENK